MITGNMTIWKPAPSTPLISIALIKIVQRVFIKINLFLKVLEEENAPAGVVTLCCGGVDVG
jgi:aldehyde dehydrogenase family 7 protein A1